MRFAISRDFLYLQRSDIGKITKRGLQDATNLVLAKITDKSKPKTKSQCFKNSYRKLQPHSNGSFRTGKGF